jgi:hypothetical protein
MPRSKRRRHQTNSKPHEQKTRTRIGRSLIWKSIALIAILLATSVAFGLIAKWKNESTASLTFQPAPISTPQYNANVPAKEYIYAGSKLLAVSEPENPPPADLAVWRPSNGKWYVLGGTGSAQVTQGWGQNGDTAAPGDFDADGMTDFSVFREDENVPTLIIGRDMKDFRHLGHIPVEVSVSINREFPEVCELA